MPSFSATPSDEYYAELSRKRNSYRKKLIAKGVVDGSMKMLTLMCRKKF